MEEDVTKIYEEYSEELLFCKYFIAEKLKHHAEMGRCGENILKKCLQERFQMLEFVTGFIAWANHQSPQCDIIVCRKNFYRRQLAGDIFLVEPNDCIMVIEVKGNATLDDLTETIEKNKFFQLHDETKHIKLAMFAFKTRIGKQRLYKEFGYKYDRSTKGYIQERLPEEKTLDYFVCLHRESLNSSARDKQVFFLKDGQDRQFYVLDGNTLAIYKLTHNIPLAMGDYQELERVLTSELGSKEDYAREFGDTPFGLLIRKIAKLDHEAAMQAFSAFINDQSLNQKQIAFVNKIINHIELNGYMENVAELTKPPFDKPISFIKLFDAKTRTALMETINQVRENAVQITAS